MIETLPPKAPDETLDYLIDASGLLGEGEKLVEAGSSITVTGATKDSQAFTDTGATVWISGGTVGRMIRITATLKTDGGRTYQRVYVIPFGEPVSLAEAKQHLRVDGDDEDELIAGYITAAREWVENYTGVALVKRTVTETHPAFGRFFDLRWRPADPETIEIAYTDADGAPQTVSEVTMNDARVFPGFNAWWPSIRTNTDVMVSYTAGYDAGDEPRGLIQAMLLLVGHWWSTRSAVSVGNAVNEAPFAVEALCAQHRRPVL